MSIIGSLPYTLANGQTADATQVMADFNTIIANVNANAAASGGNSDITSLSGLTTPLSVAQGGTGATSLAAASIVTGPATATTGNVPKFASASGKVLADGFTVGTGANDLVQLDAASKIPALDGSQVTNLSASNLASGTVALARLPTNIPGTLLAGTQASMNPVVLNSSAATAHGLGAAPVILHAVLFCLSAENGFAAGDVIAITSDNLNTAVSNSVIQISADATNVYIQVGNVPTGHFILAKSSGGSSSAITPAKWAILVFPYKVQ